MNKKSLLFIINPISGGKRKIKLHPLIEEHLDKDIFDYSIRYTEYSGHAAEIVKVEKSKLDIIAAVGGDGTINEIAKELKGSNCALAIIPQGSGNGLARHLGWSLQPLKAIKQIQYATLTSIDTAELNGHFFVSIAGIGFDSLIAHHFMQSKTRGFYGYAKWSMRSFFSYQEQDYQLKIDGKTIQRKAGMISFANSNQFGYNTKISPKADLEDGLMDICILRKPRIYQIPAFMLKIWTSRAHQSSLLEIIRAKSIQIEPNKMGYANVDGESYIIGEKVEVILHPKSLNILLPKK